MPFAPGLSGGVNPGGIAKLSGELEFCSRARVGSSEPEPVMMAPLRLPPIDSELPTAITICGCAGVATVSGTCARLVGVTGAAAEWLVWPRIRQATIPSSTIAG